MPIKLSKQVEARLIASVKRYFAEHMDEEIGDLKATLLLQFVLEEIGPSIYNQAVSDVQAFVQDKVADIDSSCFEIERDYWSTRTSGDGN